MGEPNLMTRKQYFENWEQNNPIGRSYDEIQKLLFGCAFVIIFNLVFAINTYCTGHSRYGTRVITCFVVMLAICLVVAVLVYIRKRYCYALWEKDFPYSSECEFSETHFKQDLTS